MMSRDGRNIVETIPVERVPSDAETIRAALDCRNCGHRIDPEWSFCARCAEPTPWMPQPPEVVGACECAARKALEKMLDILPAINQNFWAAEREARSAISLPCPCDGLREAVALANREHDNQAKLKDAARSRWGDCQNRLAYLETLANEITGDDTDTETNLLTLATDRKRLRTKLAAAKLAAQPPMQGGEEI